MRIYIVCLLDLLIQNATSYGYPVGIFPVFQGFLWKIWAKIPGIIPHFSLDLAYENFLEVMDIFCVQIQHAPSFDQPREQPLLFLKNF